MRGWSRARRVLRVAFPCGSIIAVALLYPLACSIRIPGPDSRPLGFTLLGCLLAANLAMVVKARTVWLRLLALLAAGVCALAIWSAAGVSVEY